ncbi:MAG: phosphatidate cytidylyltransferase [Betaproteobacteria bacterium]|nr:MAG: phosphatidate cytidylyltransferase [Betaproteobacteria bacterium]
MLKQRLLTVAVILPLLLGLMFLAPNAVWAALLAVAVAAGGFEWARLAGFSPVGRSLFVAVVAVSCAILLLLSLLLPQNQFDSWYLYPLCLLATLFWILLAPAVLHFHWQLRHPLTGSIMGWLVLVPTWLATVVMQREPVLLLLFLGAIWIADTAAYFTGRRFGRHKLAPRISPGKTIEGLVGAYVAVLVYITIVLRVYLPEAQFATYVSLWVFGFIVTSLSVEGDLFESWFKRQAGAKDSGNLLPGHGGILDRIDSVTSTMPFAVLFFEGVMP